MRIAGIICEYNPFHNGHAHQLAVLREAGYAPVCVMSGDYVQRGEPAVIPAASRAEAAVRCGAALVLELPPSYALRSAEGFADGGVELLDRLGCAEALCFGSESGDAEALLATARTLLSPELVPLLKQELAGGASFPAARQRALERLGAPVRRCWSGPIPFLRWNTARPCCGAGLPCGRSCCTARGIITAGALRMRLRPAFCAGRRTGRAICRRLRGPRRPLRHGIRWRRGSGPCLRACGPWGRPSSPCCPYGSEGLWQKVMHACRTEASLEGILAAAKSKRYPRTRLMRMLLCGFLGLTEQQLTEPAPYVRVLAFDADGPGHPAGGAGRALAPACGSARTGLRVCGNGAALSRTLRPVPGERARGACTEIARLCAKGLTSGSISHTIISKCARRTEKEREKWQLCFGSNARPAVKS